MYYIAQTSQNPQLEVTLSTPLAESISWVLFAALFHVTMFLLLKMLYW